MGWHICAANDCLLAGNVASLLLLLLTGLTVAPGVLGHSTLHHVLVSCAACAL